MAMNLKPLPRDLPPPHLICLACSAAFLLGACSGGNPAGTSSGSDAVETPGAAARDAVTLADEASLARANDQYAAAQAAVNAATAAVETAATGSEADRAEARRLVEAARTAIDAAVTAAEAAVTAAADGSDADIGNAARARDRANALRTSQTGVLDNALASFAWYTIALARIQTPMGEAAMPPSAGDGITVEIERIDRTVPTSPTDSTPMVNPKAFSSSTFKDVPYADDKLVFSVADDDEGGDEFKVDGYIVRIDGNRIIDTTMFTGLKLTGDGIVIRTGGAFANSRFPTYNGGYYADYTDMRRNITRNVNHGFINNGPWSLNGWDLKLTFGDPQVTPVARGGGSVSDWMGNGAFYWKSIVPADSRQTETDGVYYDSRSFRQPDEFKDLGTYEVWLSNYLGVADPRVEPVAGSGVVRCPDGTMGTSCPGDDIHHYLKYAAYGLFIYTVDTETFNSGTYRDSQIGRLQTLHFGYSAFASEDGKKTTDIGTAITGAKFTGQTLAYAFTGDPSRSYSRASRLLRGDATLTVNIPKSGTGTIEGDLNNFEKWTGSHWQPMTSGFTVRLNRADISDDGTFSGGTSASGINLTGRAGTGGTSTSPVDFPSTLDYNSVAGSDYDNSGGLVGTGGGYKGSFYGPRSDSADLEAAGSWRVSSSYWSRWVVFGSFAAKQKPAATPGS